jgi:hypothetical protein
MAKLYSYIIPVDDGAAPNPFGGVCTLTICKPAIRRKATEGCWIIGTGSKNSRLRDGHVHDFSKYLVYAMRVTSSMSLSDYDKYCHENLKIKIPLWDSKKFEKRMGDCLYDYSNGTPPSQRDGTHGVDNIPTDLRGKNALLSQHFYYFGSKPVPIPKELYGIIHTTQNCKLIRDQSIVSMFETWISQYELNKIYAEPQRKYEYEINAAGCRVDCSGKRERNNRGKNDTLC